jgi:hypothetical protein
MESEEDKGKIECGALWKDNDGQSYVLGENQSK